jgi:membrane fusion protein, heavy metal efflux system
VESPDADGALSAMRQAEAGERQAEASLAKVEMDHRRASELYEHRAIAQKDLLSAQNDLAQAQATLEVARAAREQARRRLEMLGLTPGGGRQPILVRSPIGGKVLEISVAPGEYRNDTSTPLMTIADLGTVWITSDVPESSIRLIRVGEKVAIALVAFPDEVFWGRVARIGDVLDPQTRTVKVHVEIANPLGRFRPEMFGSVRHAGAARPVPVVPLGAVVHEFGQSIVFVEEGRGRFVRREVALGPRMGEVAAVLKGLAPGDRVVVDGAVLLKGQ